MNIAILNIEINRFIDSVRHKSIHFKSINIYVVNQILLIEFLFKKSICIKYIYFLSRYILK